MTTVTAVVLTYNRRDLVQECLRALVTQTRRCDRIIVVDNASTDDTREVLGAFAGDGVEVYSLPTNTGAAGGFNVAMRLGHQSQSNFVWVMDDDVIPDPAALSELLRAYEILDGEAIDAPYVISVARTPLGLVTNVPAVDKRQNAIAYENWPHLLEHGLLPVTRSTFVSVLLPRKTLDRFGLPIAAMFIWGEDTEYTKRITLEHPGYIVGRSKVVHVRATAGNPDIRTEQDFVRIGWHRFRIRNRLYTTRRYHGRRVAMRYAMNCAGLALKLARRGQLRKVQAVVSGLVLGLTFNPVTETVGEAANNNMRGHGGERKLASTPP